MSDFKLDENGDLAIENNNFVIIDGADYVAQALKINLKTFFGECFMDTTLGVPYFQEIFIKGTSLNRIAAILKTEILKTPGVIEILDFNLNYDNTNRTANIDFAVNSEDGEIRISEVIPV